MFSLKGNSVRVASVLSMNSSSGFVKNALYFIVKEKNKKHNNNNNNKQALQTCMLISFPYKSLVSFVPSLGSLHF